MAKTVVGVGDLTVDVLLLGVEQVPPWGQEVEFHHIERRLGGNLGNAALGAAALGLEWHCFGPVGQDPEAEFVLGQLQKPGIVLDGIWAVPELSTSQDFAVVRPDGERLFLTYPGALVRLEQMIAERPLPPGEVVFLTGWCQPPRVSAALLLKAIERWRHEGRQVAIDLSWSERSWQERESLLAVLRQVDWVLLNEDELRALARETETERGLVALVRDLGAIPANPGIVLKRGKGGAAMWYAGEVTHAASLPVRATETVGAGDLFNAGFLHALYNREFTARRALSFATTFAGLALDRGWKQLPAEGDVLEALEQENT